MPNSTNNAIEASAERTDSVESAIEPGLHIVERDGEELSPAQYTAIYALLQGNSQTVAAKKAGVDRSTLYRWEKRREFKAELQRLHAVERQVSQCKLSSLADVAHDALRTMMQDASNPGVRLAALKLFFEVDRSEL